jgi:hypothetical protein
LGGILLHNRLGVGAASLTQRLFKIIQKKSYRADIEFRCNTAQLMKSLIILDADPSAIVQPNANADFVAALWIWTEVQQPKSRSSFG